MNKYKYRFLELEQHGPVDDFLDKIVELGEQGWRMAHVIPPVARSLRPFVAVMEKEQDEPAYVYLGPG